MATSTERINQIMKEKRLRQIDVLNLAKPFQAKYNIKFSKSHLSQYVMVNQIQTTKKSSYYQKYLVLQKHGY